MRTRPWMAVLALLAAPSAAPSAAAAQSGSGAGFYLGANIGANFLGDSEFDTAAAGRVDNDYDTGFALSGQVGYDTGQLWPYGGLRGELELSYRENEIDQHSIAALGGQQPGSTGTASTTAVMANLFHDFQTGTPLTPYVGGGIGYAWSSLDDYGVRAAPNALDDDDSAFAWQLGAGLGYAVTEQATVSLDYRYFSTRADATSNVGGSVNSDVDLDSHTVMLGLRYRF